MDTMSTTSSSTPPITFNSLQRRRSSVHHHPPLQQQHTQNNNVNVATLQSVSVPRQQQQQQQQQQQPLQQPHQSGLRGENATATSASKLSLNISSYNIKTELDSGALPAKPLLRSQYSRSSNALYMDSSSSELLTSSNLQLDQKGNHHSSLARPNVHSFPQIASVES
uniref:Uncharacterized protein n=1 Tax=Megaselia scalaris TaxID=36166 RepID=T1GYG8_MEGSC